MKSTSLLSLSVLAGAAAATYGSNSTLMCCDVGGGSPDIISWIVPDFTPNTNSFEESFSPTGHEIKLPARAASYHRSWQPSQPTGSSDPSLAARLLPRVTGGGAHSSDRVAGFQPLNVSYVEGILKTHPWKPLYGGSEESSGLGNEDDEDPPPKPPSLKSCGKRPWDASFDLDNDDKETSGSERNLFDSQVNLMTSLDLSERWLRHLQSTISTTPEVEEPEHSSSWHAGYMTALTGAALCLATTQSSDRKRKKPKTSQGESSASGTQQAQLRSTASTSKAFDHFNSCGSETSEVRPGDVSQYPKILDSIPTYGDSSSIENLATRAISHQELVAELKDIYAGLAMVERKCIADGPKPEKTPRLSNQALEALIGLYRLLLLHRYDTSVAPLEDPRSSHSSVVSENFRLLPAWYEWYSQTTPSVAKEVLKALSDFETRWDVSRFEIQSESFRDNLEVPYGNFEMKNGYPDVILGRETLYGQSTGTDSESSSYSLDSSCTGNRSSLLATSPIGGGLGLSGPEKSESADTPKSITETHTALSFDIDEISEPWSDSFLETARMSIPDISQQSDNTSSIATDLGFDPEEEWLRSFVDLEMCSDDSLNFISETTSHNGFLNQPDLPIFPATLPLAEIGSYIEPYLIVMPECDRTNEKSQERQGSSLLSPNTDTEELRSSTSPFVAATPTSHSCDSPLPPSKVNARSRKGALTECNYCHKFYLPGELKKHIKYHTKPVSCPEPGCNYTCANDHDLKRHHQTNHEEVQTQKCIFEDCKITFTRRYNLLRHIRKVHRGECDDSIELHQKARGEGASN